MKYFLLFIPLFFLNCNGQEENTDKVFYQIISQVEDLVDRDEFSKEFIVLYKLYSNVHNSLFWVVEQDSPLLFWDIPKDIIGCKGKYICWIDPSTSDVMPKEKLETKIQRKISLHEELADNKEIGKMYYIGITNNGGRRAVVFIEKQNRHYSHNFSKYPSLLPYLCGDDMDSIPRFAANGFDVCVDSLFCIGMPLGEHISSISIQDIYCSNSLDIGSIYKNQFINQSCFVTVNGADTLRYELLDTIGGSLWVRSCPYLLFFRNLSQNSYWQELYGIIRDSTFFLEYTPTVRVKTHVPFFNLQRSCEIYSPIATQMILYEDGVSEWQKEEKFERFIRWFYE